MSTKSADLVVVRITEENEKFNVGGGGRRGSPSPQARALRTSRSVEIRVGSASIMNNKEEDPSIETDDSSDITSVYIPPPPTTGGSQGRLQPQRVGSSSEKNKQGQGQSDPVKAGGDKEKKEDATSTGEDLSWDTILLLILFSGNGWALLLLFFGMVILFGPALAMIVIGSMNVGIEKCFDERIAVLLILGGIFSLLSILTRASTTAASIRGDPDNNNNRGDTGVDREPDRDGRQQQPPPPRPKKSDFTCRSFIHGIIVLVNLIWIIVTSIFVYKIWGFVEFVDEDSQFYCNSTLYLFSFSYLTIVWITTAIIILYACVAMIWKKCVCVWTI